MSKRVLLVEDEPLLAFDLGQILNEAGYSIVGPASSVARALELLDSEHFRLAILDINLGRETADPVALALRKRNIPFLTLSGYSGDQHPEAFAGAPMMMKPCDPNALLAALRDIDPLAPSSRTAPALSQAY